MGRVAFGTASDASFATVKTLDTPRLRIRDLTEDDAPFALELLNDPSWLQFIGDKGVRTLDGARAWIRNGPVAMNARLGFALSLCERRSDGVPLGICGLIRRDTLEDVDLGFAFLPRFWGRGYATEAASAVLHHGRTELRLDRIVAVTTPDNQASLILLRRLGMKQEGLVRLGDDPQELVLLA